MNNRIFRNDQHHFKEDLIQLILIYMLLNVMAFIVLKYHSNEFKKN